MTRTRTAWTLLVLTVATMLLLVSACGGDDGGDASDDSASVYDDGTSGGTYDDSGADEYEEDGGSGDGFELELVVQRTNTAFGVSMECYSFYSDGTVELRHGGSAEITDEGTVYGDDGFGEIAWDSGRSSTYEWDGEHYRVDGAQGAIIDSCLV
jgi:hypothetical protein